MGSGRLGDTQADDLLNRLVGGIFGGVAMYSTAR